MTGKICKIWSIRNFAIREFYLPPPPKGTKGEQSHENRNTHSLQIAESPIKNPPFPAPKVLDATSGDASCRRRPRIGRVAAQGLPRIKCDQNTVCPDSHLLVAR